MDEKELIALYEAGLNIREIAERAGFSYEKTRQILKKGGAKWRRNYLTDLSQQQIQSILERFDSGETIEKIAVWYEYSPPAINRLLRAYGRQPTSSSKKYNILRETPINAVQKQFLVGKLLGDGCLYNEGGGKYKLSFSHCIQQKEYFHWNIMMMDPFINNFRKNVDKRGNSIMLQTCTICHQDFKYFADMFYDSNRIKHIPKKGLDLFLTPLALAVWIQDDGTLNAGCNMRISTQGFTEEEQYLLRDLLRQCFNIRSKVMGYRMKGKEYHQLTLNKENTQKLSDIIRPFIVESMMYKIMPLIPSSTTLCQNESISND